MDRGCTRQERRQRGQPRPRRGHQHRAVAQVSAGRGKQHRHRRRRRGAAGQGERGRPLAPQPLVAERVAPSPPVRRQPDSGKVDQDGHVSTHDRRLAGTRGLHPASSGPCRIPAAGRQSGPTAGGARPCPHPLCARHPHAGSILGVRASPRPFMGPLRVPCPLRLVPPIWPCGVFTKPLSRRHERGQARALPMPPYGLRFRDHTTTARREGSSDAASC